MLPSLFEEEILHEELELNRRARGRARSSFAEALDYFPTTTAFTDAGDRYLADLERDQGTRVGAGDREPQRDDAPVGGSATRGCSPDAGADAIELNLYHVAADPTRTRPPTWRPPTSSSSRPCRPSVDVPLAVKLSPVLLGDGQLRDAVSWPRAPTGSCCSTASTNPTSTSTRSTSCPASSSASRGSCDCPCAGSRSCGRSSARPSARRDVGHHDRHRRGQGADGRRRRRDDDLRRAAPRAGAPRDGRGRAAHLDDRARVRVGRPAARQRDPGHRRDPSEFERANYMQTLHSWTASTEPAPT